MTEERLTSEELSSWAPPECPFRIVYSTAVLERIRASVTDAFYSMPRGGLETGGVLFGTRDGDTITILDHRVLECEHARGPSYALSENDLARLAELLAGAGNQPELRGMEALGWYHSHTRSEMFLSEADLAMHNRYFPEPWQLALVVRPYHGRPAHAGFFFRERDGSIRTNQSYQEFLLKPMPVKPREEAAVVPAAIPEPEPAPPVHLDTAQYEPAPEPGDPYRQKRLSPEPEPLPIPRSMTELPPPPRFTFAWIAAAVILILAAVSWFAHPALEKLLTHEPESLNLDALDINGHLWVRWNANARAVMTAEAGTLEVKQGAARSVIGLSAARLRQGGITIPRRTERVDLRLSVRPRDGRPMEGYASFVASLPERQPSKEEIEARRQRDELAREAEAMRAEMKAQATRTRRLEHTVQTLKDQLDEERALRPGERAATPAQP
jgi:proteasome lid subunit RPN8/RPN11